MAVRTKTRAVLAATVALASLALAGPAWADGLPLPTQVENAVADVQTTVQTPVDAAAQAVAPVLQPAAPVLEQAQPIVDQVERVLPEPVRPVLGPVRGTVGRLPVRVVPPAVSKPADTALQPARKPFAARPGVVAPSSPRTSEPAPVAARTSVRPTLTPRSELSKRATKPAVERTPQRTAPNKSVLTVRPGAAIEPRHLPAVGRSVADRTPAARGATEEAPVPVSPPGDRDSLVAAASAASGGSELGKTVGLVALLGLFLTPILLNAIRAEVGPFREPFLRRRARPG